MTPAAWRAGASKRPTDLSVESLVRRARCSAAIPDTVVRQIKDFVERVGGVGRIIMMTRQGLVTHAEAMKSFTLAAKEVLPQLQGLPPVDLEMRRRRRNDSLQVGPFEVEALRVGRGQPVLLIHGVNPIHPHAPFLARLAARAELIAPSHPGFGGSPLPPDFDTMYDLVQLYLDVLDAIPAERCHGDRIFLRRLDCRRTCRSGPESSAV